MEDILELVDAFRQCGGQFENVALSHSEASGFYLYALDTEKDVLVSCPASLLVNIGDVAVNKEGLFIANPENYKSNIDFLEKYFSFHFNKKRMKYYFEKRWQIKSLSRKDVSLISQVLDEDQYTIGEYNTVQKYVKRKMVESHSIRFYNKNVFMPMMSFLNHSIDGRGFDIKESGISISGKFSGEVFAFYCYMDTMMMAGQYDFVTNSKCVYAVPATKILPNGARLVINRYPHKSISSSGGLRKPIIQKDQNLVTLSWFPLYLDQLPEYPIEIAQELTEVAGMPADELFRSILEDNCNLLQKVAVELKKSENSFSQLIAKAAQMQLEIITGTR